MQKVYVNGRLENTADKQVGEIDYASDVPFIFGASQQIDTPGAKISLMDTDRRNQQIIAREEYMKDLQRRTDPNYGKSSILNTNVQENILNAQSPTGRVIGF